MTGNQRVGFSPVQSVFHNVHMSLKLIIVKKGFGNQLGLECLIKTVHRQTLYWSIDPLFNQCSQKGDLSQPGCGNRQSAVLLI